MALCRYKTPGGSPPGAHWGWLENDVLTPLEDDAVQAALLGAIGLEDLRPNTAPPPPSAEVSDPTHASLPGPYASLVLLAPVVKGQEVWAAGVTYESSKLARMAESKEGSDFYARVYTADRPELFFKANPRSVVGPGGIVRLRADSTWNVPEPELAVLIAANGRVLGYSIGNDMSSRDIEGENPLYLPQAKVYRGSCALGPVIVPAERVDPHALTITLTISRGGKTVFHQSTSTARMRRTVHALAEWLFRENDFPHGVFLLTGTGIIPDEAFTLEAWDEILMEVEGIGELINIVASD